MKSIINSPEFWKAVEVITEHLKSNPNLKSSLIEDVSKVMYMKEKLPSKSNANKRSMIAEAIINKIFGK